MIRYASDLGSHSRILLLYSARTPEEFAFKEELDEISLADPNIKIEYSVTRPKEAAALWAGRTGRVDEAQIRMALGALQHPKVFVVGTPRMAWETLDLLRVRLGLPEEDLEYEFFRGY